MKDSLVSVVIVTYNSAEGLPELRRSLEAVDHPLEIIIVDNASHDSTVELLRDWRGICVIANARNVGFGAACNQGALQARGHAILFLNPDAHVSPDTVSHLMATSEAYPRALICPTTLRSGMSLPERPFPIEETAAVPGCALFIPTTVWRSLGGFDERMFLYWEDVELCWRAWLSGFHVIVDLRCAVVHDKGASAGFRRWDAEMTKNSLYSHLKLVPWRRTGPWILRLLAASVAKTLLGRFAVWRGWWWNIRKLGSTLRERRQFAKQRSGDAALLMRRIEAYEQRQRHERRNPRTHGIGQCPACWSLTIETSAASQRCFTCGFRFAVQDHLLYSNTPPRDLGFKDLDIRDLDPQALEGLASGLAIGQRITIAYQPAAGSVFQWTPLAVRLTLERAGLTLCSAVPVAPEHHWEGLISAEKTS